MAAAENLDLLQYELEQLKQECTEFSFLVAGKSGVGKSTLLNALTETEMFHNSSCKLEAGTKIIQKYSEVKNGVTITAWDSPGFEDNSSNDDRYRDEMSKNCSDVNVLLYCISLKETRSNLSNDFNAMRRITEALSVKVWNKAVIVLTYANKLERRLNLDNPDSVRAPFLEKIEMWKKDIHDALKKAGVQNAEAIPVTPTGYVKVGPHLPGFRYWLSNLWCTIFTKGVGENYSARLALGRAAEGRFKNEGEETSDTDIIVDKKTLAVTGISVGATGGLTGATIGALIGALAIGIPSFGVAAGVGLVLGGAIGGGIGIGSGAAIVALIKKIRSLRKKK